MRGNRGGPRDCLGRSRPIRFRTLRADYFARSVCSAAARLSSRRSFEPWNGRASQPSMSILVLRSISDDS